MDKATLPSVFVVDYADVNGMGGQMLTLVNDESYILDQLTRSGGERDYRIRSVADLGEALRTAENPLDVFRGDALVVLSPSRDEANAVLTGFTSFMDHDNEWGFVEEYAGGFATVCVWTDTGAPDLRYVDARAGNANAAVSVVH